MAEKPILMIMIFQGFYLYALLLVYGIRADKKFENTKHTCSGPDADTANNGKVKLRAQPSSL